MIYSAIRLRRRRRGVPRGRARPPQSSKEVTPEKPIRTEKHPSFYRRSDNALSRGSRRSRGIRCTMPPTHSGGELTYRNRGRSQTVCGWYTPMRRYFEDIETFFRGWQHFWSANENAESSQTDPLGLVFSRLYFAVYELARGTWSRFVLTHALIYIIPAIALK